jgi:outer membrane receptor protein involved in Fe transport
LNSNETIRRAILAVLSASSAATAFAPQAFAADAAAAAGNAGLEEIVVTAQRRSENMQNVPISMQALTGETVAQLKVSTIEDFVKYLPSVSTATLGPGQGNIYMRGLSVGALGTQGQGSVGQWPNVAVYLDDQSTQIPGRNLDVYAADLERIEVLEGPQGTLFGAGAQAGVLRYITNKPKQGVTEGSFSAGYGTTAHGSENSSVEGVLNIPITDRLAVRGVIFNESRGGYIDNVYSTFTRRGTDFAFANRTGGVVPADSVAINNSAIAGNDINPINYKGLRIGAAFKVNDDWNVLLTQSFQDMNASGVFYQMPYGSDCSDPANEATCTSGANGLVRGKKLQPLQVTLFNDGKTNDKFKNTALTVTGKLASLDLVYTGARLARDSFQIQDYTNYARGVYGAYYQCTGYSAGYFPPTKCYTPSATWHDTTHNVNQSHELRLSTPNDWKVSAIGGVFWEKRELNDDTEWLYKSVPECVVGGPANCFYWLDPSASTKFNDASMNDKGRRNSSTGFADDFQRTYTQSAAFLSADWHIINSLTLTAGTRYYSIKNQMLGGNIGSFFCKQYNADPLALSTTTGPCATPYGTNLNRQTPNSSKSTGFKSRVNISWKPTDNSLVYATWSQGFRPGGFNRGSGCHLNSVLTDSLTGVKSKGLNQWCNPKAYDSDELVNKELGWKTTFLNNRLQVNGAIYQEDWKDVQTGIFAPQLGLGNLTLGLNGPTDRVQGVELSIIGRVVQGLTVQGSLSYNKTKLINSPQLTCNNPAGDCVLGSTITEAWVGGPVPVVNVFGVKGDPTANSPKIQANARARYEWSMNNHDYYWQLGFAHQGSSFSSATSVNRYEMPAWTTWDASAGIAMNQWSVELVGSNLTDLNKSQFTSAAQFIVAEVPQRPRTLGIRFGYKFKGE